MVSMKGRISDAFKKAKQLLRKYYRNFTEAPQFLLNIFCRGRAGGCVRVAAAAVWKFRKDSNSDSKPGFYKFEKPDLLLGSDADFQKMVDADPNAGEKLDSLWRLWSFEKGSRGPSEAEQAQVRGRRRRRC